MPPTLEQSAANAVAKYQSRTVTANFTRATKPGSLIVVVCLAAGTLPSDLAGPSGFTLAASRGLRDVQMSVWYRQASPSISSVSVTTLDAEKSIQLRALEYSGMAQTSVLDKLQVGYGESQQAGTGSTGNIAQADELVLGFVGNQFASTTQFAFAGGLTRLYESTSPQSWSRGSNADWERSRLSVHQAVATSIDSYFIRGQLSTERRWLSVLLTFRGGTTGPARFTSTQQGPMLTTGGAGSLTVFGPLTSNAVGRANPMLVTGGGIARIGPYDYQYRLGGYAGLLIGDDTPFRVESHDGLEGWQIRTSDAELPRGDGALRGVDLQAARQIMFELKVGGSQAEVEELMDQLYRALVPQRDEDWELIWRHPGRPLRMVRCRPVQLSRELSWRETLVNHQKFALLCADPRHYSASQRQVIVPVTPAGAAENELVSVINEGNGQAYPTVRVAVPADATSPINRVELVNETLDLTFAVQAVLPPGATLVGDMEARAIGAPRSVVTIDGGSKYGAWQQPRDTFSIGPGENVLHLETDPPGAEVLATLDYRDTWSG